MHVDDCEALRKWLTTKIAKLCEADPFTLAKYILALIRKEKPEDELRKFCIHQLYVFFRLRTYAFVDKLLLSVKNRSYLYPVPDDDDDEILKIPNHHCDTSTFPPELFLDSNGHVVEKTVMMNSVMPYNVGMNTSTSFSSAAIGSTEAGENRQGNYSSFPSSQNFHVSEAPPYVPTATKGGKTDAASSAIASTVSSVPKHERCTDYDISSDNGSSVNTPMKPPLPSIPPPTLPPLPNSPPPPLSDCYVPEPYNPESPGMNMDSERRSYIDYKRSQGHQISEYSGTSGVKTVNYESSFPPYKPQRARELIGVTISNNPSGREVKENLEKATESNYKRKKFDSYGAPKKVPKMTFNKSVLEVRKIPRHLNKVQFLIGHFKKFGTVKHIEIEYEADPEAALIKFDTEEEAAAAYRCPEPVFDNRFIKVFYQRLKDNVAQAEKVNLEYDSNYATYSKTALSSKPFFKAPSARAAYKYTSGKTVEGSNFFRQKAKTSAIDKRIELYNKKYELLQRQMSSQRIMMNKLMSSKKPAEKAVLKKYMLDMTEKAKLLQDELKLQYEELKTHLQPSANQPSSSKSMSDNGMEFNKSQENQKTEEELYEEIKKLEAKAKDLGILDKSELSTTDQEENSVVEKEEPSTSSCSAASKELLNLDCRPRSLLLSELTDDVDKENLKKHFQVFGTVENMDDVTLDKSIMITFASSDEAEKAFLNGKKFGDINLNLSYHSEPSASTTSSGVLEFKNKVSQLQDYDDDDEEEEEESEARSWRH